MKTILSSVSLAVLIMASSSAFAHCTANRYYVGGGVAFNSTAAFEDATGFQFLAGYCLDFNFKSNKSKTSVEVGYMDSGDFEREVVRFQGNPNRPRLVETDTTSFGGLWVSGLGEYVIDKNMHLMGRIGLDAGDDDGLLFGVGAGFNFSRYAQIRAEYVQRDQVESVQMNWISEF